MTRPLALDLFCCAGGSTTGLERAGFDVIGVDLMRSQLPKNSPLYSIDDGTRFWTGSGECHAADLSTADAIESVIRAFAPDFVSASPPCQAFSMATPTRSRGNHANLIPATREGITRSGVPGWIENVHGAPLHHAIRLCGSMFAETQRLRRHRFFELIGWWTFEPTHVNCTFEPVSVAGHGPPDNAQSAKYRERRAVESVHEGSNARAARVRRAALQLTSHGAPGRLYRAKRENVVTMAGNGGHGPGQNNTGPECIRWREALGWIDGPKDRYSLAQAIPPAYACWLGMRFLETRNT